MQNELAPVFTIANDFTDEQVVLIKNTIAKGASDNELALFLMQCRMTGLNPFTRQIYSIRRKQWDAATRSYKEAQIIQISIDGERLVAERSHRYAGQLGPFWCGEDGQWLDVWLSSKAPSAAKVGVLRSDFKEPIYAVALYSAYVQTNSNGDAVSRWKTDPAGMLAKCAEALALRKAFPQDLSNLYTSEEFSKVLQDDATLCTQSDVIEAQVSSSQLTSSADQSAQGATTATQLEAPQDNAASSAPLAQEQPAAPRSQRPASGGVAKPAASTQGTPAGRKSLAEEWGWSKDADAGAWQKSVEAHMSREAALDVSWPTSAGVKKLLEMLPEEWKKLDAWLAVRDEQQGLNPNEVVLQIAVWKLIEEQQNADGSPEGQAQP